MTASIERRDHPAPFSDAILNELAELTTDGFIVGRVLDPFAGKGRVHELADRYGLPLVTVGVELEPEWAAWHPRTIVADATALPFPDRYFDTVVTSPAYGNRFADSYDGRDGSKRRTYRLSLGRLLHHRSGARLHWGNDYFRLHLAAYDEANRVLARGGYAIVNVSDFIKGRVVVPAVDWHVNALTTAGFDVIECREVTTPRYREGANHELRVPAEVVIVAHCTADPVGRTAPLALPI